MRVVLTGGTGFVGPALVDELLAHGHQVSLLVRDPARQTRLHPHLRGVVGDVRDPQSLVEAFRGAEAVIHLVAIIRENPTRNVTFQSVHLEGTRHVIQAAQANGITRFILMSANGVDADNTPYYSTKLEMERMVKDAGFEWTIFRPSYIAAGDKGGFDAQFAAIVDKAPLLPSFAGGRFELQPVSRRNVAQAFARALERPKTIGQTYVLVGPERMTWNEYLRRLARLRGRRRTLVPVPRWSILTLATLAGPLFPATPDQLRMMMGGNVGDSRPAVRDLDLELERWEDAVEGLRRRSEA